MSMKDYNLNRISKWENGYPYDECNHVLNINELRDKNEKETKDHEQAVYAIEATNPYGVLYYAVGDNDYFTCFDYYVMKDKNQIALHATLNCESGGFIQDAGYEIVSCDDAPNIARGMIDSAIIACVENGVEHDAEGWNQDEYKFYRDICKEVGVKPEF